MRVSYCSYLLPTKTKPSTGNGKYQPARTDTRVSPLGVEGVRVWHALNGCLYTFFAQHGCLCRRANDAGATTSKKRMHSRVRAHTPVCELAEVSMKASCQPSLLNNSSTSSSSARVTRGGHRRDKHRRRRTGRHTRKPYDNLVVEEGKRKEAKRVGTACTRLPDCCDSTRSEDSTCGPLVSLRPSLLLHLRLAILKTAVFLLISLLALTLLFTLFTASTEVATSPCLISALCA